MSQMEMSESRTPLLGNGTPVQETGGSDQSQAAGSQDQDHMTGSPSSGQSSPLSENESGLGTSSSAHSQVAGAQVQGQSPAGSPGAERASSSPRFSLSLPNGSRMGDSQMFGFKRKMCIKFLPSSKALQEYQTIKHQNPSYGRENIKCRCGLAFKDHEKDENEGVPLLYETVQELLNDQLAVPDFTTALFEEDGDRMNRGYKWNPRDLYRKSQIERDLSLVDTMMEVERAEIGDIEFLMNDNLTSRSQFTRLSDTTELTELKTFLKNGWKLLDPMPELVISLIGSTLNKDLADKLVSSIIKISRFVNLIILTSGLESDVVAKKIGDAVTKEQRWTTENDDQSTAKARIKCVGITTWGALKEKEKPKFLKREDKTDVYHIPKNEESHGHSFVLNPGHKYFLLVDTGTTWELSRELNTFWAEVLRELKGESPNVLNLVLGKNKDAKYTVGMTEQLLAHFPVILLQHSGKYLDAVINGILQFQEEEAIDMQRARDESGEMANTVVKFLEDQVLHDYQEKNVMVVCDLTEDGSTLLVGKNLVSAMLKTLTQPLIVTAKVNAGKPGNKDVLQVVELAAKLRYWETSMDELFTYTYDWNENEKNGLKATFKRCLLQDMPEFFPVFTRVGWLPLEEFLTVEMLAQLYSENVVNDPIQVVFKRGRFPDAGANVQNLQKLLEEMIKKLWLPRCYLPEVKGEDRLEYPYKELLIWAVLSKKQTSLEIMNSYSRELEMLHVHFIQADI